MTFTKQQEDNGKCMLTASDGRSAISMAFDEWTEPETDKLARQMLEAEMNAWKEYNGKELVARGG